MSHRLDFYTKDKNIQRYLDDLMKDMKVRLPSRVAQDIGRNKTIKHLRDIDRDDPFILIASDQKFHKSIIEIRKPCKLNKDGNRYFFSL